MKRLITIALLVAASLTARTQVVGEDSLYIADLPGGVQLEVVHVAGGTFTMGSNEANGLKVNYEASKPEHRVTVGDYYIGRFEVTQAQWIAVMGDNTSKFTGSDSLPVEQVSWEEAQQFCALLSQMTGRRFRLPTEAEWEYAARAGNNDQNFSWKTDVSRSEKGCFNGNFKPGDGNYSKDGYIITSPVGAYSSNDFGLYDMSGNVAEWTSTAWSESGVHSAADINPDYQYNAAMEDPYRLKRKVIRGGSWKDASHYVRADVRSWEYQNEHRSFIGFRCVRTYLGNSKANVKTNASKKSSKGSSSAPKQRPVRGGGGGGGARSVRR